MKDLARCLGGIDKQCDLGFRLFNCFGSLRGRDGIIDENKNCEYKHKNAMSHQEDSFPGISATIYDFDFLPGFAGGGCVWVVMTLASTLSKASLAVISLRP